MQLGCMQIMTTSCLVYSSLIMGIYVLWSDKRGHQLVPLKHIKGAPTHPSFKLCQQNGARMQNGMNTIDMKFNWD